MNTSSHDPENHSGDQLEAFLSQASPRPLPPPQHEESVRAAAHAEWLATTRRYRTRRQLRQLAIAASVLVVVFAAFDYLRTPSVVPTRVATIDKTIGSIYLLGEFSELEQTNALVSLTTGQTVVTGTNSGIGLALVAGGSLRIDENSRVEFVSENAIRLRSGRIYLDSEPYSLERAVEAYSADDFEIRTDHGTVTHLGTQFMVFADDSKLAITVREGRVRMHSDYHDETVPAGIQATIVGTRRPSTLNISGYGDAWHWIERVAPTADVNGKSVSEFLTWVSHETGLGLEFESDAAEKIARRGMLRGTVDVEPSAALGIWMKGEDLDWRINNGVIYVSESKSAVGR